MTLAEGGRAKPASPALSWIQMVYLKLQLAPWAQTWLLRCRLHTNISTQLYVSHSSACLWATSAEFIIISLVYLKMGSYLLIGRVIASYSSTFTWTASYTFPWGKWWEFIWLLISISSWPVPNDRPACCAWMKNNEMKTPTPETSLVAGRLIYLCVCVGIGGGIPNEYHLEP